MMELFAPEIYQRLADLERRVVELELHVADLIGAMVPDEEEDEEKD